MSEEEIQQEASLDLYNAQLSQVEQAIQAAGQSPDLVQLRNDLKELICLTKDHLLELKKARLLKSLEESETDEPILENNEQQQARSIDDEFAAFQAALSKDQNSKTSQSPLLSTINSADPKLGTQSASYSAGGDATEEECDSEESDDELQASAYLSELVGTKCQAPFSHEFGGLHYGNAMIWSVDPPSETDGDHKVRVIFINPVHPSLIPCKYFLDGNCRFSSEDCRRSHGHPVSASELKPFEEPDHSKISEGCRCLAKFTDDVWYPGTVTDVCDDHLVNVRFDAHKEECTVQVEHIVPLGSESDDDDNDSSCSDGDIEETDARNNDTGDPESEELPVYLWKPSKTTEKLGAWEIHTKGIGSKLMAKMGYVVGQGLGPQGDGRAEPVPILLLPQGKSLDKIMELKELSGKEDLFNAMKMLEKRQKMLEKKEAEKEKQREAKQNRGVFGFINSKLGDKRDQHPGTSKFSSKKVAHASERDLTKRSDKDVNVQIFQTAEEIKTVERNLHHLKQQLARNESRDRKMADSVRVKIAEQEKYLNQLKTSSETLETHKERRTAHKKLTIF